MKYISSELSTSKYNTCKFNATFKWININQVLYRARYKQANKIIEILSFSNGGANMQEKHKKYLPVSKKW
jgi:hypothetical protein